ncbi:MAG: DUF1501 domain-containing protein [Phycisphaeraceae bacterium]
MQNMMTRRAIFQHGGVGLGAIALSSLLNGHALGAKPQAADALAPKKAHFPPRAKNVIYMHMVGAPSHLDLFDYKPELQKHNGELCPKEFFEGKRFAFIRGHPRLLGTRFDFKRHGKGGIELSELLPHLATVADDIAVVKSLHTEEFNHGPAQLFMMTGIGRLGRPSIGSWATYGLGSENRDVPAFVVLVTGALAGAGTALWGSGFLPSVYQGTEFRSSGDPVLFLSNPEGVSHADRKRVINSINKLNQEQLDAVGDPEIATRMSQYELAARMQLSVPDIVDLSSEPKAVLDMYGAQPGRSSFANNCLLARRLVERGVRFVQLFDADWDHHGNVFGNLPRKTQQVDKPMAALVKDLKQRGLLDDTLVVWGGEFGRTPLMQGADGDGKATNAGRDHHKDAFCAWLAGGGVKGGTTYGKTDDMGYTITEDPMHVNDFHATILHLLGMDHQQLTYKYQGRAFRLTDVAGEVAHKLLA